eukprot:5750436-Amphidinium_carterae.2
MLSSALQASMHSQSKREPLSLSRAGPAQPGLFQTVTFIPIRHRARENVHRVSVPVESDMDTWAHFRPCKLGPPSVPHTPSGHNNSTSQVEYARCLSTHIHSTRPVHAQSGERIGHGIDQSLASIFSPTHAGVWALTKAPWCSFGPAQNPGLPRGNHLGSASDTARR